MSRTVLPTQAEENWEGVRDEWVAAVEQLVGDAEGWRTSTTGLCVARRRTSRRTAWANTRFRVC